MMARLFQSRSKRWVSRAFAHSNRFSTSDTSYVTSLSNPLTGAINPSIEFSTTYERDESGQLRQGYYYSRINNPTRNQFEEKFTKLEFGVQSFAFASGMQAATALFLSSPGSYILLPDDLYHGVGQ